MLGAVGAAIHQAARFVSMPDDPAAAMFTSGCQLVYGAFKRIEVVRDAVNHNLQRLVILIATNLASGRAGVEFGFFLASQLGLDDSRVFVLVA